MSLTFGAFIILSSIIHKACLFASQSAGRGAGDPESPGLTRGEGLRLVFAACCCFVDLFFSDREKKVSFPRRFWKPHPRASKSLVLGGGERGCSWPRMPSAVFTY